MAKKTALFFLLFWSAVSSYGQDHFQKLKTELEHKIEYSQFRQVIEIINKQDLAKFNKNQRIEIDVIKLKALPELNLYDEAFSLSKNLISNKLTSEQRVRVLTLRALIFEVSNLPIECKKQLDDAERIFNQHPEIKPKNYTNYLIRKSSYYRIFISKYEAFVIANEAKEYCESIKDSVNLPVVELILGIGERYRNNPIKTLFHFKNALGLYKKYSYKALTKSMYFGIGKHYFKMNDYNNANLYVDSARFTDVDTGFNDLKGEILKQKSMIMEKFKKLDSALYFYKLADSFSLIHFNEEKKMKLNELDFKYKIEADQIQKKQLETNITNTKKSNTRLFIFVMILVVLLISLVAFLWLLSKSKKQIEIQRQKISQKNEALSNTLNEKQFLVEELNHRVKNNLSVILSLISFQKDEAESDVYKNKFDNLYQRIRTIALAHDLYAYSVNHNDHSLIELPEYANKIFEALQSGLGKNYTYHIQAHDMAVKVDKALPLGLILNELITNSIKHAQPENQQLVLNLKIGKTENHKIKFEYFDNGTVFNIDNNKESLGLFIIEGMVKQLRGSYQREHSYHKILFAI